MTKSLYIETWGCQMNSYDSNRIADLLFATHGLKRVETPWEADVLLMNTCSVREKAEEKVFSKLGTWRPLKENKPSVIIGVGGCVASQEGKTIRQRAPFVDLIFGPQTLHRLPFMLNSVLKDGKPLIDISFPTIEKFDNLPAPTAIGPTALVSIQEGCNKYCKYCIVPYTRGEEVNRPFEDVLAEVSGLAQQGVREITLLGQNVNAYRGPTAEGTLVDLGVLIAYVSRIPGIGRIRFTTSHPTEFNDSLIHAYATVPALADHLHLPVQSGSDRILRMMGRTHTVQEYKNKIRKLREVRPTISVSSDFIVGYPGETEDDFNDTLALAKDICFDHSYSFMYSPRPGTLAAQLPDDVSLELKKQRLAQLQAQIDAQAHAISESMVGSVQKVLVAGPSKRSPLELSGRTDNNRVVNFIGDKSLIGQFVQLKIIDLHTYSLRGEILEEHAYSN
jgi:tRNA-2-methylthio-N6-dimethylallyladenosine synthase